ncbi:MAG: 3-dehydroquinate synthase [Alphaproteobacteria bacterium]|nr:3-dehydroquinate synthase [Alphaproteobacteria bacterium]
MPNSDDFDSLLVNLDSRSYEIFVGMGLVDQAGKVILPVLRQKRVFIVTDENVAKLYLERFEKSLDKENIAHNSIILPAGEKTKSFDFLNKILDAMFESHCERSTTVIALGGGVIGDITGFAASIFMRGIDFIQVPTTLLSQVDSSVGGKTGINTRHGKNLVGSFYQPKMVLTDIETLDTLDKRQLLAGFAEAAKYGLIDNLKFWSWLEKNGKNALNSDNAERHSLRRYIVMKSCTAKAKIVEKDEQENGIRALLNLGHTFSHAIEIEADYKILHGEGVAIGMVMAFSLSEKLGYCSSDDVIRVKKLLESVGLPTTFQDFEKKDWNADNLCYHMNRDKKVKNSKITFVLAKGIGQAFLNSEVSSNDVFETITACSAKLNKH